MNHVFLGSEIRIKYSNSTIITVTDECSTILNMKVCHNVFCNYSLLAATGNNINLQTQFIKIIEVQSKLSYWHYSLNL